MTTTSMELAWIVVKDLKEAIKFYVETIGLKLVEHAEEYGWAELQGQQGGARLGIAQYNAHYGDVKPGQNAFVTFSVQDIEESKDRMKKKGAKFIGETQEVPGQVKLQMIMDSDGNQFQIAQKLRD